MQQRLAAGKYKNMLTDEERKSRRLAYYKKYRETHKDKVRAAINNWNENNKERRREINKRFYLNNPGARKKQKIAYFSKEINQLKDKARKITHYALIKGELIKPKECPRKDCHVSILEAHHPDYAKPLDVKFLCRKHHMDLHRKYT